MDDLKKYIQNVYMDYKFPLLKRTNEEIKEFRNQLNKRGMLRSGAAVSGPYQKRKDYICDLFHKRIEIEVEAREMRGIEISESEFKKILRNINESIDHEFDTILNETRQDATMVNMNKDAFENSIGKRIDTDKNSLKSSVKRHLERGKYELEHDKEVIDSEKNKKEKYDAFLCHASEDKEEIANDLFQALTKRGKKIWYDNFVLKLGDPLRQKIDEGLLSSNYGIVILSKNFFKKNWPKIELDGLYEKETSIGKKVILPIWHDISKEEIQKYSFTLAGRIAVSTSAGLEIVVKKILEVLDSDITVEYSSTEDIDKKIKILATNKFKKRPYDESRDHRIKNVIEFIIVNDNSKPINITKIVLSSDFSKFTNHFFKIDGKALKAEANVINMQFNTSPLVISGDSNFTFQLHAYTTSRFEYSDYFVFEYELHTNEAIKKIRGDIHIEVIESIK